MGCTASAAAVQEIYRDAIRWFHMYIDKATYSASFRELDKDEDGGVTHQELQLWIEENSRKYPDSCWTLFLRSSLVIMIAHKVAASQMDSTSSVSARKVVDITEYRALLIHIYAISILWRHFACVDVWKDHPNFKNEAFYRMKLTLYEFETVCRSVCTAHNTIEQYNDKTNSEIKTDFEMLDTNYDGFIGFVQVCSYCTKYIDLPTSTSSSTPDSSLPECNVSKNLQKNRQELGTKAGRLLGLSTRLTNVAMNESQSMSHKGGGASVTNVMGELKTGSKSIFASMTEQEKLQVAMEQLKSKIVKENFAIKNFHAQRHLASMLDDIVDDEHRSKKDHHSNK